MASLSRGGVSSVKKAAEAPIWKSYLAIRSDVSSEQNEANPVIKASGNGTNRGRKRTKSLASRGGATGSGPNIWMTLATPLTTRRNANEGEDGAAVLRRVRQYWEQLSVNERQQILFMDEPELVKLLYKLNLSLLCVGLMQRHLKTSNRTATNAGNHKAATEAETATANTTSLTTAPNAVPPAAADAPAVQERTAVPAPTRAATDTSLEKTYELLEAMEFMDIGTGILTVKTELAEDTNRLFSLVGDVLVGFLTSIHVLTETNFNKLFVSESETINTWANYQRLIAMLVEQLILKSYVNHLEKEAAQQMEQLLLEVSLEDSGSNQNITTCKSSSHNKKKSKKKKKRKSTVHTTSAVQQNEDKTRDVVMEENSYDDQVTSSDITVGSADGGVVEEPAPEPMPEPMTLTHDDSCELNISTEPVGQVTVELKPKNVEGNSKHSMSLNPNASVFQPQEISPASDVVEERNPYPGKRKFDEYIVSVPTEDVAIDDVCSFESRSLDGEFCDVKDDIDEHDHDSGRRRWRKQRRCEEDAELEWQLQQVYASTSSLFGWDFSNQCELASPGGDLPWSTSTLWRTAPKEVVRYFSPGVGDTFPAFTGSHFLPPSGPSPSRYYFNPPFGPSLLPPSGMEPLPPSLHGEFGFQPSEFPMVVSPDFSSAHFHPNPHPLQGQAQELPE